jgi:hypothetical protein
VTKLRQFSPAWRLFTLASFMKIAAKVSQIFGRLFLPLKFGFNFVHKWIGPHSGRFYHNRIM